MAMRLCYYVPLYLAWFLFSEHIALWSRLYEMDYECEHPALPDGRSGVKVIVAGFAKTGTRTMSRALYQIGLEHSYHSEEFGLFVWSNLADKFWLRRSGGSWSGLPNPGVESTSDAEVLNGTSSEELAAAISRCRVDAIAFDAIEQLFWPVYKVSEDAKVIVLNWRAFAEWRASLETFMPQLWGEIFLTGILGSATAVLPWGALFHVIDPLIGRQIETMLRTGGPPICQVYDGYTSLWHGVVNLRRIATRWMSGISFHPETQEDYEGYFRMVKQAVPPENLFEWDMRRHKFEDLCRFLGMESCPKAGRLPRANNLFIFQRDFPIAFVSRTLVIFILHWVNWKIFSAIFSCMAHLARRKAKVQ